jgi:hypothetical protein
MKNFFEFAATTSSGSYLSLSAFVASVIISFSLASHGGRKWRYQFLGGVPIQEGEASAEAVLKLGGNLGLANQATTNS